jgi:hypothetical protein
VSVRRDLKIPVGFIADIQVGYGSPLMVNTRFRDSFCMDPTFAIAIETGGGMNHTLAGRTNVNIWDTAFLDTPPLPLDKPTLPRCLQIWFLVDPFSMLSYANHSDVCPPDILRFYAF